MGEDSPGARGATGQPPLRRSLEARARAPAGTCGASLKRRESLESRALREPGNVPQQLHAAAIHAERLQRVTRACGAFEHAQRVRMRPATGRGLQNVYAHALVAFVHDHAARIEQSMRRCYRR
eukprot:4600329-Pleurochrysis_carterae.AAC.4